MVHIPLITFLLITLYTLHGSCFPYQADERIYFPNGRPVQLPAIIQITPMDLQPPAFDNSYFPYELENPQPPEAQADEEIRETAEDEAFNQINDEEDSGTEAKKRVARSPKEPKTTISIDAQRDRQSGTAVSATATRNLWSSKDGNTRVNAYGRWSRVYNRPNGWGTSRPDWGAGIGISRRF